MQEFFKTILIPTDLTLNTEVAICKALEIADAEAVHIHLVHVLKPSLFDMGLSVTGETKEIAQIERKLLEWKNSIEECMPYAEVTYWIIPSSSVYRTIVTKAKELKVNLVVIGKKSSHIWFPFLNTVTPDALARETESAVLTVKPGSLHNKIKKVVVPVTDNVPHQKMNVLAALCKKNNVKIFLVTFINKDNVPEDFSASSLLKVYQWLKTSLHCPVEYAVLHGQNKAKAMLSYAQKNNADILLVHPETETKIGWPGNHIYDVLPPASKVQVLSVKPASLIQ